MADFLDVIRLFFPLNERQKEHVRDLSNFLSEDDLKSVVRLLKQKKVEVHISQIDIIVPYECGNKLIQKMKNKGLNPIIRKNRFLGHYGTIFLFYKFYNSF